jgi:Xaa-Pro aminopeptidase
MTSIKEYKIRRQKVAERLQPNSIAIIPAAREVLRNGDAHYRFRQDSDFFYLTGFNEPDSLLVITSGPQSESILFNLPKKPDEEQWTGIRLGQEKAIEALGVDRASSIDHSGSALIDLMADKDVIYSFIGRYSHWDKVIKQSWEAVKGKVRQGIKCPNAFKDLSPIVSELRLFKTDVELEYLRKAASASVQAHKQVMRMCQKAENEYELEATFVYEILKHGCRSVAYDPIVASGDNACILHYNTNNKALSKQDLILIDAGGEYNNYAADITRTYPVSGVYTGEQRAIYDLVLGAQKTGIEKVGPGTLWNEVQTTMVRMLTQGLVDLGILVGDVDGLIEQGAYKPFYMHNSGHWLGLDVHDCGAYKVNDTWRVFEPGMVLTVEPGIYINPGHPGVDGRWHGIGVRIEDDIAVTPKGFENLSGALPVDIDEIEALICG